MAVSTKRSNCFECLIRKLVFLTPSFMILGLIQILNYNQSYYAAVTAYFTTKGYVGELRPRSSNPIPRTT
ncbi:hypothetical protein Syn7502_02716 [Synechococcus sp. PCC 7502]|nr:hypothetical protein Syn7502_02716 [Synechococcus sp. PCC 7502]